MLEVPEVSQKSLFPVSLTLILHSFIFSELRARILNKTPIVFYHLNLLSQSQSCYHIYAPMGRAGDGTKRTAGPCGGGRGKPGDRERQEKGPARAVL